MTDMRSIADELGWASVEVNVLGNIIAALGELLSPMMESEEPSRAEMTYIYMRRKMISAVLGCASERADAIEKNLREQSEELFAEIQRAEA